MVNMIFRYDVNKDSSVLSYLIELKIPSNVIASLKNSNGQILVNDQTVSVKYQMKKNDYLEIVFPASSKGENIKSVKGPLDILYEDAYLLIINKDSNVATIPTRKHYNNSLANFVMSYYLQKGIVANIHFVSRLDAATSGIIVLAKNSYMLTLMKQTTFKKYYLLEVKGSLEKVQGVIECGIEKDPNSIIKRRTTMDYINSKTIYKVIKKTDKTSIVEALLCTGKTHQLRVHFAHLNHPIIGDLLYNEDTLDSDSILHLHSYKIEFIHPITLEKITIENKPKWLNI